MQIKLVTALGIAISVVAVVLHVASLMGPWTFALLAAGVILIGIGQLVGK